MSLAPNRTSDPSVRVARILSDIFSPAVSVFLICVLCGAAGSAWKLSGFLWGSVIGCFCAVIPMIVVHIAVRRGRLTDRHVTRREQRWWVLLICVGSVICGLASALLFRAPDLLLWALPSMIGGLVVVGAVTLGGTKASLHAFCFTALGLLAAILLSPWWLLVLLVLLPVVAFARLRLNHHTPFELVLGAALAVAVVLLARLVMPDVA